MHCIFLPTHTPHVPFIQSPGKTCIIGAGYVALECGGFLTALGCDTTIAVRSVLLRGFDREYSDKIGEYMEKSGTKFQDDVYVATSEPHGTIEATITRASAPPHRIIGPSRL